MRYLPKSPSDREQMMREIGIRSIDELFAPIPPQSRLTRELNLPAALAESEIIDWFRRRAAENGDHYTVFLGAGAYRHYRPVVIDALISRGEFFTAYTPYQPEVAQGTLQSIFEFQTMICELTGMEVANASMYDGSTGTAEAVMMACRVTGRNAAVIARTVHPEYREVLGTYARHQGLAMAEAGYLETGRIDVAAVERAITGDSACLVVQSPNFFGTIEDVAALAEVAHGKGALLVVVVAEAVSLGIVRPPAEADIVALEAQSFGIPLGYGGPYAGVIATKEKLVRQMPGRLVGETHDTQGKRGFVLTLSTREQHIRREKATSNICTNQALMALMANIFLTVYGREGLKELARHNLAKTAYAVQQFESPQRANPGLVGGPDQSPQRANSGLVGGPVRKAKVLFQGAPRFNEFVVQTAQDPYEINERLLQQHIIGGFPVLKKYYPELGHAALWCCTEMTPRTAIDRAAEAVAQ